MTARLQSVSLVARWTMEVHDDVAVEAGHAPLAEHEAPGAHRWSLKPLASSLRTRRRSNFSRPIGENSITHWHLKADAEAKDAVMVGDTTWDIHVATAAGAPTIAVRTGSFGQDEL